MTTNLELPEVFSALKNIGFNYHELLELEYCGNLGICKKAMLTTRESVEGGFTTEGNCDYNKKEILIRYLKAWVEILQEEQKQIPKPTEQTREDITHELAVLPVDETSDLKTIKILQQ